MKPNRPRSKSKSSKRAAPGSPPLLRRPRDEVESRILAAKAKEEEAAKAAASPEDARPAPRPGRNPAAPQLGRFVAGPVTKRPLRELEREALRALILEVRANPRALLGRLDATFARPDNRPIDEGLLRRLLDQHGLGDEFARVERENLRTLLRQQRGFEPPIRRLLGLSAQELRRRIQAYGLGDEILELKERTREEARADAPLLNLLQLATSRADQLRDAGVLQELDARNLPALEEAMGAARPASKGEPGVLLELSRRALAIDPSLWRKVVVHYRLDAVAARLLGLPPPEPPRRSPPPGATRGREGGVDPGPRRGQSPAPDAARGRGGAGDPGPRRGPAPGRPLPRGGRSR